MFFQIVQHINYLDAFAAAISLFSTILGLYANILSWPISCISYVTSGILYYQNNLYSNVFLEIAYFAVAAYGFYNWMQHRKEKKLTVHIARTPQAVKQGIVIFVPLLTIVLYLFVTYKFNTDPRTAIKDALATAISLPALWIMGRRYVECWILWFVADLIHSYLYFQKGLFFKGNLHTIYLAIAVWGYFSWKKKSNETVEDLTLADEPLYSE